MIPTYRISPEAYRLSSLSYQSSVEKFQQNGFAEQEAIELMRRAVRLTSQAVSSSPCARKTVLSLSCYGSMCTPGQEYAGIYPPPYGPPTTAQAEQALADWHYDRLLVFANDQDTWSRIDMVAIETLPLLSEGIAVRKAMHNLRVTLKSRGVHWWPKWWTSFVFPEGKCPENASISSATIAKRILEPFDGEERPTGLGINCTKLRFLPQLVAGYTQAAQQLELDEPAWLVIYPDGGLVYDVNTRTWHADGDKAAGENADPAAVWASQLHQVTLQTLEFARDDGSSVWEKAVVGGCCKASPEYIRALAGRVKGKEAGSG